MKVYNVFVFYWCEVQTVQVGVVEKLTNPTGTTPRWRSAFAASLSSFIVHPSLFILYAIDLKLLEFLVIAGHCKCARRDPARVGQSNKPQHAIIQQISLVSAFHSTHTQISVRLSWLLSYHCCAHVS